MDASAAVATETWQTDCQLPTWRAPTMGISLATARWHAAAAMSLTRTLVEPGASFSKRASARFRARPASPRTQTPGWEASHLPGDHMGHPMFPALPTRAFRARRPQVQRLGDRKCPENCLSRLAFTMHDNHPYEAFLCILVLAHLLPCR